MTAVLNQNPLINVNSDNVSSIVLAHNKNIISIFEKEDNEWDNNNDYLFDDDLDENNDIEMKLDDDDKEEMNNKNEMNNNNKDEITNSEIFEYIRNINDPEHPLTLEQLNVVSIENIMINDKNKNKILINYTPTIPHCSMATLIGLSLRVKLLRSLPQRFKVKIKITPGTHKSEKEINKQLNDKERVAAALENYSLIKVVNQCIKTSLDRS